jgi:hypothetical protein
VVSYFSAVHLLAELGQCVVILGHAFLGRLQIVQRLLGGAIGLGLKKIIQDVYEFVRLPQKLRQLRDIRPDPPRLVAYE